MKATSKLVAGVFILLAVAVSLAAADSTEKYIKQLSNTDAEVRAKAAHELGCG
jgi:hypothetical protein